MAKGRQINELIEDLELRVHNVPSTLYTYQREGMGRSNIDVTITTQGTAGSVSEWTVRDLTDSDHRLISFKVSPAYRGEDTVKPKLRYDIRNADWVKFGKIITSEIHKKTALFARTHAEAAEALESSLARAAKESIPLKTNKGRIRPPWWNHELTE